METVVLVAQHQKQYYTRSRSRISNRFSSFPTRGFRGINCRSFQSGVGIPPSPPSVSPSSDSYSEPKSPQFYSEPFKRSNPIAISPKPNKKGPSFTYDIEEFSCHELWAGPTYSNSPPPSSLPIPKFSVRPKRSVSFELPRPSSRIELPPVAKSAPASPTGDSFSFATENLRRILHLDDADD